MTPSTNKNAPGRPAEGAKDAAIINSNCNPNSNKPKDDERFGATVDEWTHFDLVLGLTADLLPVVSDPNTKISPHSNVKEPGKVPSRFNRSGEMIGFPKWTEHRSTENDISVWSADPRFGLCIQTRQVRAIDVDIPDFEEAFDVECAIVEYLGFEPPARRRGNSEKFLMAVIVEGDLTKERFKTSKGVIEFLATGQQFIAIGTHPSGVKYEWSRGLPNEFPVLGLDEFRALWSMLNERFGIEDNVTVRKGMTPEKKRQAADIDDPLVTYMVDNWTVHDIQRDGRVDILCPFEDGHSSDSGTSSTSYYPAGVGGFAQGHFKCLHASCAHRKDQDFKSEIGYNSDGFDIIEISAPLPSFVREQRGRDAGKVKATRQNLATALAHPRICGFRLRFDTFLDGLMVAKGQDGGQWREFRDEDYYAIALHLEAGDTGFAHINDATLRDAVHFIGRNQQFDTAQDWLEGRQWDGVPRVVNFLARYMGAPDNAYSRAVSLYFWSALAGRIITPGVKADMTPVAVGEQGLKKTSLVYAIAPEDRFAGELDLSEDKKEIARSMRGKLIMELGELNGMDKRSIGHLKAFLSRQKEEWRPVFKEYQTTALRRCMFFGTTNDEEILVDDTGNRRWLPFRSTGADPIGLAAVRDQLWAEGAHLFRTHGVIWEEAERLAKDEHAEYLATDPWDSDVLEWLRKPCEVISDTLEESRRPPPAERGFTNEEALRDAVNIPVSRMDQRAKNRMAKILKKFGFYVASERVDGYVRKIYRKRG